MIYCARCGVANREGSNYCNNCGHRLAERPRNDEPLPAWLRRAAVADDPRQGEVLLPDWLAHVQPAREVYESGTAVPSPLGEAEDGEVDEDDLPFPELTDEEEGPVEGELVLIDDLITDPESALAESAEDSDLDLHGAYEVRPTDEYPRAPDVVEVPVVGDDASDVSRLDGTAGEAVLLEEPLLDAAASAPFSGEAVDVQAQVEEHPVASEVVPSAPEPQPALDLDASQETAGREEQWEPTGETPDLTGLLLDPTAESLPSAEPETPPDEGAEVAETSTDTGAVDERSEAAPSLQEGHRGDVAESSAPPALGASEGEPTAEPEPGSAQASRSDAAERFRRAAVDVLRPESERDPDSTRPGRD